MTVEHEFSIPVRDLDASGRAYRFPIRASWLRGALEGTDVKAAEGDGELSVRLSKSGTDVVVHGSLKAELVVPCARCLEPAHVHVDDPVSVLAVPQAAAAPAKNGEEDAPPEQADVIAYDGETVVLDDLVRDELLLGIPMIPLCSDACPGISPQAKEPEGPATIDPRLRPLLRLKKSPSQ